jgi:UDP-N-acetylglucosamine 2-epimerase (non-hydrolysing)
MSITCIVGARPNFVKAAPLLREFRRRGLTCRLVHTGQHYDAQMSDSFFDDLDLPQPDAFLAVGSGPHGSQTGTALIRIEQELLRQRPSLVVVLGDVNSTLAGALAASKLGIPVAHVEAGYRSFDRAMPEEINRVLVDHVSDLLFAPTPDAITNLSDEGISEDKIFYVGSIMAESLLYSIVQLDRRQTTAALDLLPRGYAVATIHRPENTDRADRLAGILEAFSEAPLPVLMPLHPRTLRSLEQSGLGRLVGGQLTIVDAQPYLDMLSLIRNAALVLTDSGGVQEEACVLQVPCLTIRENTERVATIAIGANRLVPAGRRDISDAINALLTSEKPSWDRPERWDKRVSARIADVIEASLTEKPREQLLEALNGVA